MRLSLGAPLLLVAVAAALSLFGCGGGTEHADAHDGAAGQDAGPADHARDAVDAGAGPDTAVAKDARDDGGATGADALDSGSAGQPDASADLPPAGDARDGSPAGDARDGSPAGDAGDGSPPADAHDATTGGDAGTGSPLGATCGGMCNGAYCFAEGSEISRVCAGLDATPPCIGTPAGMYCTKTCRSDADCAPALRAMKCLVSCPGHSQFAGICWSAADEATVRTQVCAGDAGADGLMSVDGPPAPDASPPDRPTLPDGPFAPPDGFPPLPDAAFPDAATVGPCRPNVATGVPCPDGPSVCTISSDGAAVAACVCISIAGPASWICP